MSDENLNVETIKMHIKEKKSTWKAARTSLSLMSAEEQKKDSDSNPTKNSLHLFLGLAWIRKHHLAF